MNNTNQGLGPNKLFFKNILLMYFVKHKLANAILEEDIKEIVELNRDIIEYEKNAIHYFNLMSKDKTLIKLLWDEALL